MPVRWIIRRCQVVRADSKGAGVVNSCVKPRGQVLDIPIVRHEAIVPRKGLVATVRSQDKIVKIPETVIEICGGDSLLAVSRDASAEA